MNANQMEARIAWYRAQAEAAPDPNKDQLRQIKQLKDANAKLRETLQQVQHKADHADSCSLDEAAAKSEVEVLNRIVEKLLDRLASKREW